VTAFLLAMIGIAIEFSTQLGRIIMGWFDRRWPDRPDDLPHHPGGIR
jgi:hypothetical protein